MNHVDGIHGWPHRLIASLAALALAVPVIASFSGTDLFLPSVGRGPGANESQWYTTAWIYNPSATTANVSIRFLERKQPNPSPVSVTISVPPGDTARYANVIADLFHYDNKFGALRFVSDQKIVVTCRIFNLPVGGSDRDTQGQDYGGIPAAFGIGRGETTHLLGVYQTSTDRSVSPFRYSFGLTESAGGTASVHVKALDETGAVVAEKDYGPLGAYEAEYYPIEDLSPSISAANLRLEIAVTDGPGKIIAVGSGVANRSNDGTTFEMAFADSLLGGGGLATVAHDGTLAGEGTVASPLGIASNGVTSAKIAAGQVVKSFNGLKDDVAIAAGANITLTPSGNTLTIAATGGGGGGGSGVPSVNGITSAVTINGSGAASVATAGSTITVSSPLSLPPDGVAGGSLAGTYPSPGIATGAVGTTQLADLAVIDAKVASGIAYAKLSGTPTSLPPSGAAGGSLAGTYPNPGIANNAVGTPQIADLAVTDAKVTTGIAYAKLSGAPTSLPPNGAAGGSLNGTFPNPGIANGAVATAQLADGSVTPGKVSASGSASGQLLTSNGAAVSWQNAPGLTLPYSGSATDAGTLFSINNTGSGNGIWGQTNASGGAGIYGYNPSGNGIFGNSASTTADHAGVFGYHSSGGVAVYGWSSAGGPGVYGKSTSGDGVIGDSTSGYGVLGRSGTAPGAAGVCGTGAMGVFAQNNTAGGYGIWGQSGTGYAGWFQGNVNVNGTLSKTAGSFKIDHPLDPERKYLYHSFVESPDMMNVYNGNAVLDPNGEAVVVFPEWFEALNRDFRYQLTSIGGFAPVYVAEEIADNRFRIAGGKPGMRVSWQVTGIRKDPFANAHRIPVEQDKPAIEQGSYLHPDAYGQPEEKGVEWALRPEMMREMKKQREQR